MKCETPLLGPAQQLMRSSSNNSSSNSSSNSLQKVMAEGCTHNCIHMAEQIIKIMINYRYSEVESLK